MSATVNTGSQFQQAITVSALRSYAAEFISTFLFVFTVVGSSMSARKMASDAATAYVAEALAHAFALSVVLYISSHISRGFVNPAVTFGLAVGGHISIPTAMFYWAAQLVASTIACLFLRLLTAGNHVPISKIAEEMTGFGGSILEGILTFALACTVYTVGDPRRGSAGLLGPIVIGFAAGSNVLASGPFTGGSTNPARCLGSAMISGDFKNQAVYWVGPLIGAALAGLVYEHVVFPSPALESARAVEASVI